MQDEDETVFSFNKQTFLGPLEWTVLIRLLKLTLHNEVTKIFLEDV